MRVALILICDSFVCLCTFTHAICYGKITGIFWTARATNLLFLPVCSETAPATSLIDAKFLPFVLPDVNQNFPPASVSRGFIRKVISLSKQQLNPNYKEMAKVQGDTTSEEEGIEGSDRNGFSCVQINE